LLERPSDLVVGESSNCCLPRRSLPFVGRISRIVPGGTCWAGVFTPGLSDFMGGQGGNRRFSLGGGIRRWMFIKWSKPTDLYLVSVRAEHNINVGKTQLRHK
jgi:hypothetical protein